MMAKQQFPQIAHCISDSMTPMVATARIIKEKHPNARVVFIGPCASKKLEAMREDIRSDVDFVITFEELMGIFQANNIEFSDLQDDTGPQPHIGHVRYGAEHGHNPRQIWTEPCTARTCLP